MSISDLKLELDKRKNSLHQWSIKESSIERDESYVVQSGLEQSRSVRKNEVNLSVWVPKKDGRLGYFTQSLRLDTSLGPRIDQMIDKASLSSQEFWAYPESDAPKEFSKSLYKAFQSNLAKSAQTSVAELKSAVAKQEAADFNSAELFISTEENKLYLSTGFEGSQIRSKIYAEVCFSAKNEKDSNEFLVTRMGAHPEQMNFYEMCKESSEGAKALLEAEPTPSGTYQCMVNSEVLGQIFSDAITHLDAENRYYNMPFQEKGESFIKSFDGDSFELSLDPGLEYGLGSCAFSSEALEQKPKLLVANNEVKENLVSAQMGQYLNWRPTTVKGNLVIKSQSDQTREQLLNSGPILEILQFSALFSSPRDLAFSSEIRLARLWELGKPPRYVRGGNFSGQFKENCRNIKFTQEEIFRNLNEEALEYPRAYQGPAYGVLNDIIVSS